MGLKKKLQRESLRMVMMRLKKRVKIYSIKEEKEEQLEPSKYTRGINTCTIVLIVYALVIVENNNLDESISYK